MTIGDNNRKVDLMSSVQSRELTNFFFTIIVHYIYYELVFNGKFGKLIFEPVEINSYALNVIILKTIFVVGNCKARFVE